MARTIWVQCRSLSILERSGLLLQSPLATEISACRYPTRAPADVPIMVAGTGVITDVNVKVRLNHTFDGERNADPHLVLPASQFRWLPTGKQWPEFWIGRNGLLRTPTVLDDGAATAISAGTAPFAGSFRPESPLSVLNGTLVKRHVDTPRSDTAAQDRVPFSAYNWSHSSAICLLWRRRHADNCFRRHTHDYVRKPQSTQRRSGSW